MTWAWVLLAIYAAGVLGLTWWLGQKMADRPEMTDGDAMTMVGIVVWPGFFVVLVLSCLIAGWFSGRRSRAR